MFVRMDTGTIQRRGADVSKLIVVPLTYVAYET